MVLIVGDGVPSRAEKVVVFSVWVQRQAELNELAEKGLLMKERGGGRGTDNYILIEETINKIETLEHWYLDEMGDKTFGVFEMELPNKIDEVRWFVYFAYANYKACVLLISEERDRLEALRRSLRWIRWCAEAARHGNPVLIGEHGIIHHP